MQAARQVTGAPLLHDPAPDAADSRVPISGVYRVVARERPAERVEVEEPSRGVLFGRMYEDSEIERAAFARGARVLAVASAGCTALALSERCDVTACGDAAEVAYLERRLAGEPVKTGTIETIVGLARSVAAVAGWTKGRLEEFLALSEPSAQATFFQEQLDTWGFRTSFDAMLSSTALKAVLAPKFVASLPVQFGAVLRRRLARGLAHHPNATNPYARALLLGETIAPPPLPGHHIDLAVGEVASYLESAPPRSFDGFTLSNVLDGAAPTYRDRLFRAVRRSATRGAIVVFRSLREPTGDLWTNQATRDRAMLWGIVDVRPVALL